MSSDASTPAPREDEPSQSHDEGISARRPDPISDPESVADADREEGIAAPSPSGAVPRIREFRERWDDEDEIEEESAPVPNRHPGLGWSILWCLFYLLVTQIIVAIGVAIIVVVVEMVRGGLQGEQLDAQALQNMILMPALAAAQVAGIIFSLIALRLVAGRDWYRQVALARPGLAHFFLVLIGFPALPILASGAYLVAKRFLPGMESLGLPGMEQAVSQFREWPWVLSVLIVGVGPGLAEELWCRAFLGRGLVGNYGLIFGVLFTSMFFGLIHIDPVQGTMAALMGIVLHYSYITTRSLMVPMLLHFLNNSLSVIASHISGDVGKEVEKIDSSEWMPWYVYAAAGFLLIAVGWSLYQSRARLVKQFREGLTPWQPPFPGVALPPPGSDHVVVRPWPHWSSWVLSGVALWLFLFAWFWNATGGDFTQLGR
jgi:membrane protease YdiL (CAAX protease family)